MDSIVSNVSPDTAESIGCDLIAALVKERGGCFKAAARPANMSPETIRTWSLHRRKPSFHAMFEMMVYEDFLFEEFIKKRESRRAECQMK